MATMFGYNIEPDFDIAKDKRRNFVGWAFLAGLPICIIYDVVGLPFAAELLQAWPATILPYGVSFYVNQRNSIDKAWLWKAFAVTVPIHGLYLFGVFWSDGKYPELMTKVAVFLPVLAVGAAVESLFLFDRIIGWLEPQVSDEPASPPE